MNAKKSVKRGSSAIKIAIWAVVIVVAIVLFIILVKAVSGGGSSTSTGESAAPAKLVSQVTSLPQSLFLAVGQGSVTTLPKAVQTPALTSNGKPLIVYMGAEYCPYCAAERWPMVIALSHFGTWSGLQLTHSSTTDVFAGTQTFSFHGASLTADLLALQTVEMQSNVASGSGYATLETPTAAQQALLTKYDTPPYTSSQGGIPFIDFGGSYISSGASYDPGVLAGKSQQQIADTLSDPSSPITQGIIGASNVITATICSLTHNQPGNVCANSMISSIQAKVNGS